ncbi:MAG: hypothetical protein V3S59_00835 [Alphaproteobacteria bacterium]
MLTTLPRGRFLGAAPSTGEGAGAGAPAWAATPRVAKALAAAASAGGGAGAGNLAGGVMPAAAAWAGRDDKA